ncbi:MAG: hypothetical protein K2X87_21510 [Gemmataceae bacterium]|nr:hypothetical protein [Gemmataceae bacterium]
MTRLTGAVAAMLLVLSPATATLDRAPRFSERPEVPRLALGKKPTPDTTEIPPPPEAQLTTETEVLLDGQKCRYRDVPSTAAVVRMVVAPDGLTITRVEFRTRR